MTAGSVLVVVVNYRTPGLTIDCLRSLEPEVARRPGTRVAVVENASGDDSAGALKAAIRENGWSGWVTLLVLDRNGGFAAGNNAAIAPALETPQPPDYLWLLNPDTIVRPGALEELAGFLDAHPGVGLAGSRLEHLDGTPQGSAFRFPSVLVEFDAALRFGPVSRVLSRWVQAPLAPDHRRAVDWVAGASLMVRREVFASVGLLDEGYFMYFEEVDFCRKALRHGWPCWYVPESRVVHLVGRSSGVTSGRRRRPAYWFHARSRYFARNLGHVRKLLADVAWASGYVVYSLRRAIERKPEVDPPYVWRDFLRYNFLPHRRAGKATVASSRPARAEVTPP